MAGSKYHLLLNDWYFQTICPIQKMTEKNWRNHQILKYPTRSECTTRDMNDLEGQQGLQLIKALNHSGEVKGCPSLKAPPNVADESGLPLGCDEGRI